MKREIAVKRQSFGRSLVKAGEWTSMTLKDYSRKVLSEPKVIHSSFLSFWAEGVNAQPHRKESAKVTRNEK